MTDSYAEFLRRKALTVPATGIADPPALSSALFDFQRDIVRWALRLGKAAVWAGTGLGKSRMAIEWARVVAGHTGRPVLILTPLAVADQFVEEGARIGVAVTHAREATAGSPLTVTNYERLHKFDASAFGGIVLDESSVLRDYTSKTRNQLIEAFASTPFRLCCSATPAPNDFIELGNHAEFLGVMTRTEMLAMFFVNDFCETQKWRLKGHAAADYWRWLAGWAVNLKHPRDLGYATTGYDLPPLSVQLRVVDIDTSAVAREQGLLFASEARSLSDQRAAKRASIDERVALCADLVNGSDEPWIVWCLLNSESAALAKAIPDAVEVTGSMPLDEKEERLSSFARGRSRVLVSKASIAGWGLNLQHCARMCFASVDHSFESYFQAIRRCWRFGQRRPVEVHVLSSEQERAVLDNLRRKEADAERLTAEMVAHMAPVTRASLGVTERQETPYEPRSEMRIPDWLRTEVA